MNLVLYRFFSLSIILTSLILSACNAVYHSELVKLVKADLVNTSPYLFKLTKIFPSETYSSVTFDASIIASPVLDTSQSKLRIIVPISNGMVAGIDAETGALDWQISAPTPEGQRAELISTPVVINNKLVILYQCLDTGVRTSHRLAVIDLRTKQLDSTFPVLIFAAEQKSVDGKATIKFNPPTAYSHAALKHIDRADSQYGFVYAAFGNAGDIQPFHGWFFEIDMDVWQKKGAQQAIRNVLLTTQEAECPSKMEYGTQEMICGGGIWVPTGPLISQVENKVEIFIPTGNGQVDLARHDYANALMRVKPGLQFDAGCDARLCANFNPLKPDPACMTSCRNLFIPRLAAGNAPIKPPYHECDDKDFWECLAWMDYDLGANTPIKIELKNGRSVLVQAGKDGGAYLLDAEQLGRQYDRLQIAKLCGSPTDLCKLSWAGMIVTQPVQTIVDDESVAIIPTFSADKTNGAGLVALKIVLENNQPKFKPFWRFPEGNAPEALQMFRSHPSFPVLTTHLGHQKEAIIWIVDIGAPGTLYGIRAKDGVMVAKQHLQGSGRQLSMPLIVGNKIYLASIVPNTGKAMIEAYRIASPQ